MYRNLCDNNSAHSVEGGRTLGREEMASKGQMTGMLGVYLTAVELVKRGFIVSPTSRSAMGADLLVTDQRCHKAWSVQVKTNSYNANFWLTGAKARELSSKTHIYVFVNAPKDKAPLFYVVPSVVVSKKITGEEWHSYYREEVHQDRWDVFGDPEGPMPVKIKRSP
jgi:hypothetical protein